VDRWLNQIICGDNVAVMRQMPDRCIDLTVTSPPYDNLRTYNGFSFNFEEVAQELYRITKDGGVVVWVVGDATIKGSETGTSFRQALFFMKCGFNLHDTMIYKKSKIVPIDSRTAKRYAGEFEYMFVFSKGKISFCNYIKIPTKHGGKKAVGYQRSADGSLRLDRKEKNQDHIVADTKIKGNVWEYASTSHKYHPAPFPEQLAKDHIISWSNEGDVVLDPMCGSGTTCKMAKLTGRNFIGIDVSEEYCEIARQRVKQAQAQQRLFGNV
jgi:DNA modification methylase